MPFPAQRVGLDLTPHAASPSVRDILAYAAGLGASEPAFLDDARPGGALALPFQCVSLEWPVILSLREALADSLPPAEAQRAVHAVQDSEFHQPIRPGCALVTEGRLVSARRIRAGVLSLVRLTTRDALSGEPVVTSWSSSIYRDVALEGEEHEIEAAPALPVDLSAPPLISAETTIIPIPREMPHVYSECANIWNPIHTERAVAIAAGLPDIILHGTATWALAGLTILRRYGGSDLSRMTRLSGRFSGMVIPGEPITVRHAPAGQPGVIRFEVLAADGQVAVSQGVALIADA